MANLCAWPPTNLNCASTNPWSLSVNSCNHQSAKYPAFSAHQPCMRWLGVIYGIKSIKSRFPWVLIWCNIFMIMPLKDRRIYPVIQKCWNDSLYWTIFFWFKLFKTGMCGLFHAFQLKLVSSTANTVVRNHDRQKYKNIYVIWLIISCY